MKTPLPNRRDWWLLLAFVVLTAAVYWSGLSGGFVFDDFPNIVDNHGVQPHDATLASLVNAALSSPASEFKRPLASLSFAMNYLASGLDPYWMKLTNLVIHLLNGWLVFLLSGTLIQTSVCKRTPTLMGAASAAIADTVEPVDGSSGAQSIAAEGSPKAEAVPARIGIVAALIAGGWMLLPINLTGVLYVVQRMESMANLFVLLGLIGYVAGRRRMLGLTVTDCPALSLARSGGLGRGRSSPGTRGFLICIASITLPSAIGILAKETAVMLPLYAVLIEWFLFAFRRVDDGGAAAAPETRPVPRRDRRIIGMFLLLLALPMIAGVAWLLPGILDPRTWAGRDFTLSARLLSEARIVVDYIIWTLLPTPDALSFYHDNFLVSHGLLTPWTTLASIVMLAALVGLMLWLRRRQPLAALGIALFLGCQLLTCTILPLELIYEHRNYFASFGLLLAIVPLLAAPPADRAGTPPARGAFTGVPMALPRYALMGGLMLCWAVLTALTAYAWGNPLRLAEDLASRAPQSPRAEYELGRTYIILSHYDPASPFTRMAYAPLERSAALRDSSILPEQALIFMNARMHLPLKDAWWNSMVNKLKAHSPTIQDESSLSALTQCVRDNQCNLPKRRMMEAFLAALSHPGPSARLLATYGDYAWNVMNDHVLGERMIREAVKTSPSEPAYQITLIRMLAVQGRDEEAEQALQQLTTLNIGGRLDRDLASLRALPGLH